MRTKIIAALMLLFFLQTVMAGTSGISDAAAGQMTKYRVYQNDKALQEFTTEAQAIAYAKKFGYSHVETIAGRTWIWDNFPRYKVYQNGLSNAKWEFRTYEQALSVAKKHINVHIRDLENIGWQFQSYAKFRLYQGDLTLPNWSFLTLDAAKQEAKKWANAHIIDLSSNKWVWGNLTSEQTKAQRAAKPVYQITVDGLPVQEKDKLHSFLFDAIQASAAFKGSEVKNTATGKVVHSNVPAYSVVQNEKVAGSFVNLDAALQLAKKTPYSEVMHSGTVLWSGIPYLTVYQGDKKLKTFHTRASAVAYAKYYANSSVRQEGGRVIWSNSKSLVYLAWNGSATSETVLSHVANTQGLSIDSPTWFELAAADGTINDTSDKMIVTKFKEQGIQVMPLVHNQFDRKMTSEFLKNNAAQKLFINTLAARLAELGVPGVNLDFEEVAGSDRGAYTAFVTALAKAVHAKGMKLSIDLPRGSVNWNHLTAYDHAALASIVDTVIIMAYDEHWSGSDIPGPVAGLKWTEEGVKQFLNYGIPRSKLMLGIPFYVREWKLDSTGKLVGNRAIFMKEIPKLIADTKAKGVHDSASGQMKYTYVKDGFTYQFWAETENTIKARIQIAKAYDLAGVAAWRLGYESSDLWTMMLRMK
ncbi:glycosyl hydrolase family 18 protein [Paenibacillus alkaliterrae]|uniref:glycosyl hydrolase family 18 protein n=1 Tax=Paenibacillus alkaliterrae TaxID=320909 RepID=UPI001F1D2DDE|nr:glycosyl hydrolase family 18 protein [Paenibacillus alkaliterrae]MCF2938330.1 glycosyl hydrolase family 18 protein [Paenibacillus alkaliterrae]